MKFKDIVNQKINSRNNQVSFDLQKRKVIAGDIDMDDLMEMDISRFKKKKKEEFFK